MDDRQAPAAPWYSPDGRWYWDGSAWQPVARQAAVHGSPRRWRPGRKLYAVAVLVASLAALPAIASVRGFFTGFPTNATRVTGSGTHEVTLTEPGTYTISFERQVPGDWGVGFAMGGEPLANPPSGTISMQPTYGEAIQFRRPSTIVTYGVGETEGEAIAEFDLHDPGTYLLTFEPSSEDSGASFTFAIARGSPSASIGSFLVGGLAAFELLLIGIAIAVATLLLRRAPRQRVGTLAHPPVAFGPWEGQGYLGALPILLLPLVAFVLSVAAPTGSEWPLAASVFITGLVGAVFCAWVDRKLAPGRLLVVVDPQNGLEMRYHRIDKLGIFPLGWFWAVWGVFALSSLLFPH